MKWLLLLFLSSNLFALTVTVGPSTVTMGVEDTSAGTLTITNPQNITSHDGVFATANSGIGQGTHYAKGTDCGFSIPANARITGIQAEIFGFKTGPSFEDNAVYLVKSDGTLSSRNFGSFTDLPDTPGDYRSYGDSTELWGEAWSAEDINSANFGLAAGYFSVSGSSLSIDDFRITVTYTTPIPGIMFLGF